MIRVSRAPGRGKGSLPPGRAAEGVPVPLRIKYSTPDGDIAYRRTIWPLGSRKVPFPQQESPSDGGSERDVLKKDSGRGNRQQLCLISIKARNVLKIQFFNLSFTFIKDAGIFSTRKDITINASAAIRRHRQFFRTRGIKPK